MALWKRLRNKRMTPIAPKIYRISNYHKLRIVLMKTEEKLYGRYKEGHERKKP